MRALALLVVLNINQMVSCAPTDLLYGDPSKAASLKQSEKLRWTKAYDGSGADADSSSLVASSTPTSSVGAADPHMSTTADRSATRYFADYLTSQLDIIAEMDPIAAADIRDELLMILAERRTELLAALENQNLQYMNDAYAYQDPSAMMPPTEYESANDQNDAL